MADVWISRKRWTCKYCDVTINDDLPSRRHHESGLRHKRNVEEALQGLYRKSEQERKDAEETKKEMARIEALAAESFAKDQASGSKSSAPSLPSSSAQADSIKIIPKPAAGVRAKPLSASARHHTKASIEANGSTTQLDAQAGEWEVVQSNQPSQVSLAHTPASAETSDRDRARSFRMTEKVARLDDSDDDVDHASSTIKVRKRSRIGDVAQEDQSLSPSSTKREEAAQSTGSVKSELDASAVSASTLQARADAPQTTAVKKEEEDSRLIPTGERDQEGGGGGGGGGLFKKRRAGAGAGAKRVRAVI